MDQSEIKTVFLLYRHLSSLPPLFTLQGSGQYCTSGYTTALVPQLVNPVVTTQYLNMGWYPFPKETSPSPQVHVELRGIWVIWLILWPCYLITAWKRPNFHLQIHQSSRSTRLLCQSTTICRTHTNTQNFMVMGIYTFESQGTQSLICLASLINQSNIYGATWLRSQHCVWCNRGSLAQNCREVSYTKKSHTGNNTVTTKRLSVEQRINKQSEIREERVWLAHLCALSPPLPFS